MKEFIFILSLLVPVVSGGLFGLNIFRDCYHHPPQFQMTLFDRLGPIGKALFGFMKKCAYTQFSEISDYVNFHLIRRGNYDYQQMNDKEMAQQMNKLLPTFIIFHGFTDGVGETDWMKATGKKILENVDANVILVDYRSVSYCNYIFLAKQFIFDLAKYIAVCINEIWTLQPNQIKVIGHSLGGHIAGLTGTHLKGQIDEIIALDPAGPGFDGQIFGMRQNTLNSSCARFVQVLHTKTKLLGTHEQLGDSDFFANCDQPQQPGCSRFDSTCSHSRSYELYFASCFAEYQFIGIEGNVSSRFGFFNDRTSGLFHFNTGACFGYALN